MAYDRVKYIPTVKRIADELWDEIRLTLSPEKTRNTIRCPAVSVRKELDVNGRCCQRNMALDQPTIDDSNNGQYLRYFKYYGLDC